MNQKGWHCLMRKNYKFINDWIFLSRSCSVIVLFKPHGIFRSTLFYEMVCIWIVHIKGLKCCEMRLVFCTYRPGLSWVIFIVNHDLHCCRAVDEKPWNICVLFWSCEWLEANFPYPNWVWDVFVYLCQQLIFVRWCFKTSWGLLSRVCSWLLYQNHPTA